VAAAFFVTMLLYQAAHAFVSPLALTSIIWRCFFFFFSRRWCSLFNADLALSVTMTAISTILSLVMLPANLLLYTHFALGRGDSGKGGAADGEGSEEEDIVQNLDWTALFVALAIVISAIGVGLFSSYRFHSRKFNRVANQCGNVSGLLLVIFSATLATTGGAGSGGEGGGEDGAAAEESSNLWDRPWTFYVAIVLPCLGGLILANAFGHFFKLLKPEQVTVAIECCYQNVGIATSLALTMFDENELKDAMAVPFLYGLIEAALVGSYCLIAWKLNWTKAPAKASLCKVLLTSYEIEEYERKDLDGIEVTVSDSDDTPEVMDHEEGILTTYFNMAFGKAEDEQHRTPVKERNEGATDNIDDCPSDEKPSRTKHASKPIRKDGELA